MLAPPFRAATGFATDSSGNRTDTFGVVVYATSESTPPTEPVNVDSNALAAVIDILETIDLTRLRDAYKRVVRAKGLSKAPVSSAGPKPRTTVTLGIILARETAVPLEELAQELDRQNAQHPDRARADMLVVLSKGTINYAVQFPGGNVEADFLPPAEDAFRNRIPPMYVQTVVRPTGDFAFNKMCAFLLGHLAFFSPGYKEPDWKKLVEGIPREALTISGYQYNLKGQLVPVPPEFWNDRYIPPRPFLIQDRRDRVIASVQFLPWQDGGVLFMRGKLPIEAFLVLLGKDVMKHGSIFIPRPPDIKISYVLPITQANFVEMLKRFQRQSNMVVRSDPTQLTVQKFLDEGSSSPFVARIFMGILRLRDVVFPDYAERQEFDKAYEFVSMNLLNLKASGKKIIEIYTTHSQKVAAGEIARIQGFNIQVDESINKELRGEFETCLNLSVRVLKHGMQNVAKSLDCSIGFLFKDSGAFQRGVAKMQGVDPALASYLLETRRWSEQVIETRNNVEHTGWMLPHVTYLRTVNGIQAQQPQVSGQSICNFVEFMTDRIICFVEEVSAHLLLLKMPERISVTEIPLPERLPEMPERFRLTLTMGGLPSWQIKYHNARFEEV